MSLDLVLEDQLAERGLVQGMPGMYAWLSINAFGDGIQDGSLWALGDGWSGGHGNGAAYNGGPCSYGVGDGSGQHNGSGPYPMPAGDGSPSLRFGPTISDP